MTLADEYLSQSEFNSYEDFKEHMKLNIPENFNFAYDVVDRLGREKPDKTALVWCNVAGRERSFTFREIMEYSNRTANLFQKYGIKKGDSVMLILKRNYQFWFCILALHKIGAVVIPATHLLTKADIVYRNNAADIKMIVSTSESEVYEHIEDAQPESPTLQTKMLVGMKRDGWVDFNEEIETMPATFDRPTSDAEMTHNGDKMLLYFTSGTTSHPKMVLHDFTYPLAHIPTAKYWQNVTPDGLHLTVADTGWGKAVWGKLYGQWLCETAVFVYDFDRFVPHDLLTVMSKYKVTTFCAPATIYRFFAKEDLSAYDLSALQYCCVAGEPLNPEIFNSFQRITGHRIMEGFGQTETVLSAANYKFMEPRPGSMGKPSPLYDVDLLNGEGKSCEIGEEGEIVIRLKEDANPGLFLGYYKDEEKTREVMHDGLYYTGDIAWKDEDGYFWFVGRADDVIKSSGYRIGPFEVESVLMEHPAVLETAITGVPDPVKGQVVKATIVLTKNYQPSEALKKEIQDFVKHATAPYKYPRVVEFVDELPKTISGKIKRSDIRKQ